VTSGIVVLAADLGVRGGHSAPSVILSIPMKVGGAVGESSAAWKPCRD